MVTWLDYLTVLYSVCCLFVCFVSPVGERGREGEREGREGGGEERKREKKREGGEGGREGGKEGRGIVLHYY